MARCMSPRVGCEHSRVWPSTTGQWQAPNAAAGRHSRRCDGGQAQAFGHCAAQQGVEAGNGAAQPQPDALQQGGRTRGRPGVSRQGKALSACWLARNGWRTAVRASGSGRSLQAGSSGRSVQAVPGLYSHHTAVRRWVQQAALALTKSPSPSTNTSIAATVMPPPAAGQFVLEAAAEDLRNNDLTPFLTTEGKPKRVSSCRKQGRAGRCDSRWKGWSVCLVDTSKAALGP